MRSAVVAGAKVAFLAFPTTLILWLEDVTTTSPVDEIHTVPTLLPIKFASNPRFSQPYPWSAVVAGAKVPFVAFLTMWIPWWGMSRLRIDY